MYGLAALIPGTATVTLCGRTWRVGPLRLRDFAALERLAIRDRVPHVVAARRLCRGLDRANAEWLAAQAWRDSRRGHCATVHQVCEVLYTVEGLAVALQGVILDDVPISVEAVRGATDAEHVAAVETLLKVSGLASDSSWPGSDSGGEVIAWRTMRRRLAELYHWSPDVMDKMTLGQVVEFAGPPQSDGRQRVGIGEAAALLATRHEECQRSVQALLADMG